jgi:3-phenylpropionate/cinnamic acid dioxygenase small subunit
MHERRDPGRSGSMMKLSRAEAEDFLFREAELLDSRQFEEWLKLFTPDGMYWLPMEDNSDPKMEPSVIYDDAHLRAMRVHQLVHKPHYSQRPRSRTVHAVSNIVVRPADRSDEAIVRCTVMVTEMREGNYQQLGLGEQRLFSGHCEYRLRQGDGLAIALKKLVLINRDTPIVNLSFIL